MTFVRRGKPLWHRSSVDGVDAITTLARGSIATVKLLAREPGVIGFESPDRQPSMRGSIVVLPKPR